MGKPRAQVRGGRLAAVTFLGIVLLQGFHVFEHVVQVFQHFVLGDRTGAGILGSWIDIEPVHFVYNGTFLLLLALAFWLGGFLRSGRGLVFWLMVGTLVFQSYHFVEHIFKLGQFLQTGMNGTPGILGHRFPLVWLHFTFNTVVYAPVVAVFFLGGFAQRSLEALRATPGIGGVLGGGRGVEGASS